MSDTSLNSCLYTGWVRHRRLHPKHHEFKYPIFMTYWDLDELENQLKRRWFTSLERFNVVSFKRDDFLTLDGAKTDKSIAGLKNAVKNAVGNEAIAQKRSFPDITRVTMLTHLRYFNVVFNPVTFYYCFDKNDDLVAILAEITNTPWDERFHYVMFPNGQQRLHHFDLRKEFHVSPFNPMEMDYRWKFNAPDERCTVFMENYMHDSQGENTKHFDATLNLRREPLENFGKLMIRFPNMCVSVVVGIYWQALKLWLKKVPFYDNPSTTARDSVKQ